MIASTQRSLIVLVPLPQHQVLRKFGPSTGRRAGFSWKRHEASGEQFEVALGDEMAVEWFERGRAAAYEPGVYLEDPVGMSSRCENRIGHHKKKVKG